MTAADTLSVDAQLDELLSGSSPEMAAVARELRAVVAEALPDGTEQVDFGNRLLAIGRSMKMRDLLFAIIPHSAHVNLQLADGIDLPNPGGLIEGTGKRIRHIKVRSVDAARSAPVRAAIDAQIAVHT
ncbi:MAG TPA: hypothetical protein VF231_04385 [Candidatus Limnocylindrales bacterium]